MLEALSLEKDFRIRGYCVTARADYAWFLEATRGSESNLQIQRQIIKSSKAYATLRADLRRGCVLPPLVLAAQNVQMPEELNDFSKELENERELLRKLSLTLGNLSPENVQIIDGLQRTNAIRQTVQELEGAEKEAFLRRRIRFEIWLNLSFNAIAYRMLLLNAGQKPMSMKHQVEILSLSLKDDLADVEGIEIITAADNKRRLRPGQFHLSRLAQAFQAWLQTTPNIEVANAVMQELLSENAIETLGMSLGNENDSFKKLMQWIVKADYKINPVPPYENLQFFGNDTVLQGLAAAAGFAEKKPEIASTLWHSLDRLLESDAADPLGVEQFNQITSGMNPSKRNVGVATRELVFNAFQQYFLGRGEIDLQECWLYAGSVSRA